MEQVQAQRTYWSRIKGSVIQKCGKDNTAFMLWFLGAVFFILSFLYPNENNVDALGTSITRGASFFIFNGLALYWKPIISGIPLSPKQNQVFQKKTVDLLIFRHLIISIHSSFYTYCQFYLPLPIVHTIYFSGPLFILLIERLVCKQSINRKQALGAFLAIVGVLLTSNGIMISSWMNGSQEGKETNFQHYKSTDPLVRLAMASCLILLTFGWAYSIVLVRYIRVNSHFEANIYFGKVLIIFTGILYCLRGENPFDAQKIDTYFWCFIYHGIPFTVAQLFYMQALLMTKKTGIMSMIGFLGLVLSYLISTVRYGQEVNGICLTGGILVVFGICRIVMNQ